jgi:hypothetical protein
VIDDRGKIILLPPEKMAWLKRSDVMAPSWNEVWELPDGRLYLYDRRNGSLLIPKYVAAR